MVEFVAVKSSGLVKEFETAFYGVYRGFYIEQPLGFLMYLLTNKWESAGCCSNLCLHCVEIVIYHLSVAREAFYCSHAILLLLKKMDRLGTGNILLFKTKSNCIALSWHFVFKTFPFWKLCVPYVSLTTICCYGHIRPREGWPESLLSGLLHETKSFPQPHHTSHPQGRKE